MGNLRRPSRVVLGADASGQGASFTRRGPRVNEAELGLRIDDNNFKLQMIDKMFKKLS